MSRFLLGALIAAVVLTACGSSTPSGTAGGASPTPQTTVTPGGPSPATSPLPSGQLTQAEAAGLRTALQLERNSTAMYAQVISDLGQVQPFVNVLSAEQTHVSQIQSLFTEYAVPLPQATPDTLTHYTSLSTACAAAAQNEQQVISSYDQLKTTTSRSDILTIYTNLQSAARDSHLPAFQRC